MNATIKQLFHKTAFLLAAAAVFTACKPEPEGELGAPFSKIEGLTSTMWEIEQVVIIDGADPARRESDFSEFYLQGEDRLSLKFNSDGSFEIFPGEGVNFLPDSGEWRFDDDRFPTQIVLNPEGDTRVLHLESPTRRIDKELRVRFDKHHCQLDGSWEAVYSYALIFKRVEG